MLPSCHRNDPAPYANSLGRYFTIEELTRSDAAERRGVPNTPAAGELAHLRALVREILDPLREHLGRPIMITSGFRSEAVNRAVNGSATSQHRLGQAADFHVQGMTPAEICQVIRDLKLPYDQLIEEFGSWVHVSYAPSQRRQFLLARKQNGKTVYLNGAA